MIWCPDPFVLREIEGFVLGEIEGFVLSPDPPSPSESTADPGGREIEEPALRTRRDGRPDGITVALYWQLLLLLTLNLLP
jgi:hypothetical protein